jgi:hypothetical protein
MFSAHNQIASAVVNMTISFTNPCENRTVKTLVDRDLVRWVWAQKDNVPSNGITLTQDGADTLVPLGMVTWPEKSE